VVGAATVAAPAREMELELAPGVKLALVRVPAGEFLMGSDKGKDPDADDDEQPQHRLRLGEYWIGKYPVTNAQYKAFVDATGYAPPEHWEGGQIPAGKENHPVVHVSWYEAVAFCEWAGLRLPTEAEWEKAARGTDGRTYPWGNQAPDKQRCNFNRNIGDTTRVGQYPAGTSPYGCLDMAGNVWEWTSSMNRSYPYRADDGRENLEVARDRIVRGGSWDDNQRLVRAADRSRNFPENKSDLVGFRCALSP